MSSKLKKFYPSLNLYPAFGISFPIKKQKNINNAQKHIDIIPKITYNISISGN
jgi:hypothetical protein